MDLNTLLSNYPGFGFAGSKDNSDILQFFDQTPMNASELKLRFERRPDFFKFLKFQSDRPLVFIARDEEKRIGSVATITIRPGYISGKKETICYLGDLRIGTNRRIALNWRKIYSQLIDLSPELSEMGNSRAFITSILDDNKLARASLVQNKKSDFEYRHLASYQMVNLILRLKHGNPTRGIEIRQASSEDLPALWNFLEMENKSTAFGYDLSEWKRRLDVWPGLKPSSFVLALDGKTIQGTFALWSPSEAKQIVIDRMPAIAGALCGLFRPIFPRLPRNGDALSILYMTHLHLNGSMKNSDRTAIFRQMIDFVYDQKLAQDAQFLSYSDFNSKSLLPALKGIVAHKTPISLYQVVGKKWSNPLPIEELGEMPPAFEMSLV